MSTVKVILKKDKLKDGTYPIVIRVNQKGKNARYIKLDGFTCNPNQWSIDLSRFKRNKLDYKFLNKELDSIEERIEIIHNRLRSSNQFTFQKFKDLYFKGDRDNNLYDLFTARVTELENLNRIGSSLHYKSCQRALYDFTGSKDMTVEMVDNSFIRAFKNHQLKKGNTINTTAVYLRGIRAIVRGYYTEHNLNIPTINFDIKTEDTKHRAITKDQLKNLVEYEPKSYNESRSKDLFLLSFYLRGINLMDLAKLTKDNIVNDRIEYRRSKTATLFSLPINKEVENILSRYSSNGKYLLPILKRSNNIESDVNTFGGNLNRTLKRIAQSIGIKHLTFYYARYTYASLLKDNGTPISIISELLGHSSVAITKTYLSKYSNSVLDSYDSFSFI